MFVLQTYMTSCNHKRDIYFDESINNKKENKNFVPTIHSNCEFMFSANYQTSSDWKNNKEQYKQLIKY